MSKKVNDTLGIIKCPFTGKKAEVRQDASGNYYFQSKAGKITPNLEAGQDYIEKHAIMLTDDQKEVINSLVPRRGMRDLSVLKKQRETKEEDQKRSDSACLI